MEWNDINHKAHLSAVILWRAGKERKGLPAAQLWQAEMNLVFVVKNDKIVKGFCVTTII